MEISKEQIAKMAESYKKAETQHVAQRAVTKNGILESAESVEVLKRMSPKSFAFSIDVDDQAVANQKMSGRCWMFACLNVLRFHIEKELDLPKGTFELSQAYLAFFNKLERAAWFLEHAVATADKPLDNREVDWLFTTPMADGGDWDMVCALVKKYGGGLVCLALGGFLILRSDIVVRILPIVFGLFVIFDSLGRVQSAGAPPLRLWQLERLPPAGAAERGAGRCDDRGPLWGYGNAGDGHWRYPHH